MDVEITTDIAKNLYAAISADTGSFKYSSVRPRTMNITAELLKRNINHSEIARQLYDTEPLSILKLKGCLMNRIEQYYSGQLDIITVEQELLEECKYCKDSGKLRNCRLYP